MFLGWPMSPIPLPLFFGFLPILLMEHKYSENRSRKSFFTFWGQTYLAFLLWNVLTTWWVINASAVGGIAAFTINSLLMTFPIILYSFSKKAGGVAFGLISLISFWLTFEYIHLNWDMSWPWLNLGNGLSMYPWLIQWYSATGVSGGSAWILLVNALLFLALIRPARSKVYLIRTAILVVAPVMISVYSFSTYEESGEEVEIVVVQPNIDPYSEKFVGLEDFIPFPEQIRRFIELTESGITGETDFVLWPETALDKWIQERNLLTDPDIRRILEFKERYPDVNLITGLTSYTIFGEEKPSATARYREDMGYFETYNTAFWIGDDGSRVTYHKSKLVPGVEIMPYPALFNFLIDIIFDLGGTTGGYGKQEERTVFFTEDGLGVAPSICYESIYGDFMSTYVRNGAGLIFIITNDGWWGDTPGYRQHLTYARMRAIEGRRSIARSANTGISGYINQRGEVIEATDYWVQDVRNNKLRVNDKVTFYAKYGDYIARTASWLSAFLVLGIVVGLVKRK